MLARVVDVRLTNVVIDCSDPRELSAFWSALTGVPIRHAFDDWVSLEPMDGGVRIAFQKVPEPKTVKNRVHMDLSAEDEETTAREIVATLGARRLWVSEDPDDPFVVLADPEGNEFCIVRRPAGERC